MEKSEAVKISEIEFEDLESNENLEAGFLDAGIELINNVKVNLDVIVGKAEITVADMFGLKEGAIVSLEKEISSPIEIMLDGKVIACGSLVAVGDKFGIKVTQIHSSQ